MIHLTKPDAVWLSRLLDLVEEVYEDYPELFSNEDEEVLAVTGELIRSINK